MSTAIEIKEFCQFFSSDLFFLQLNLGHRVLAHDALIAWLWTRNENWVLIIQEPFFTRKGLSKLPKDYGGFWTDDGNSRKKVRALIITPKILQGYMVTQRSSVDCVTVRFNLMGISVISVYCPLEENIEGNMRWLIEESNEKRRVICGMDSNSYHSRWGSNLKINKKWSGKRRGEELNECIDRNGFMICNVTPHLATFTRDSATKNESHIDITICTTDLFNVVSEWQVKDETFSSDHRVITFVVSKEGEALISGNSTQGVPWKKPKGKMEGIIEETIAKSIRLRGRLNTTEDIDMTVEEHSQ